MNPPSGMQKLLEEMAARRATGSTTTSEQVAFAAALHDAKAPAWDPHEVWLTRVKQPRDLTKAG